MTNGLKDWEQDILNILNGYDDVLAKHEFLLAGIQNVVREKQPGVGQPTITNKRMAIAEVCSNETDFV